MKATRIVLVLCLMAALPFSLGAVQLTTVSKSFNVSAGGTLTMALSNGDVTIDPGASGVQVEVAGIDQKDATENLSISQSGNDVNIELKDARNSHSVRFKIAVPSTYNLNLRTAGGDIAITAPIEGQIGCKTAGGDIAAQGIRGDADLTTAGGDIHAGAVSGAAQLTTAGGDIAVESVGASARLKTSGGDISVGDVGGSAELKTAGGDISLGSVHGTATTKTAGGDIHIEDVQGEVSASTAGGDISVRSAAGKLEASTAGGDVKLRSVSGPLSASTAGGDIEASLQPGDAGPRKLSTSGGDIKVSVSSLQDFTLKATVKIEGDWSRETAKNDIGIFHGSQKVQAEADQSARELRATLGNGPRVVELSTVNGKIVIND